MSLRADQIVKEMNELISKEVGIDPKYAAKRISSKYNIRYKDVHLLWLGDDDARLNEWYQGIRVEL